MNKIDNNNNPKWLCEKFGTNTEPESAPKRKPEGVSYKKEFSMVELKIERIQVELL